MTNVLHLRQEWSQLGDQMKGILAAADAQKRDMTSEEQEKFDRLAADADALYEKIERFEKHEKRQALMDGKKDAGREEKGEDEGTRAAFLEWMRTGIETRELKASDDSSGGLLVPDEQSNEILKSVIEFCPFRSLARVTNISGESYKHPKRTGTFGAQWVGETTERTETDGLAYGIEEIFAHELHAMVPVSRQVLEDSAVDLEAEINMEAADQFGVAEAAAFITGNGVKKPMGVAVDPTAANVNSGTNGDFDGDDLIDLLYGLKGSYAANATWLFNRATLRKIRKLKANNEYIWSPATDANSIVAGLPGTILGRPFLIAPEMADTGTTGAISVIVGDFRRGYRIVDRVTMGVTRDPFTAANRAMIRFWFYRRVGGSVVMGEAIRRLREAA
jgi:HK97 family phage major capsid protein